MPSNNNTVVTHLLSLKSNTVVESCAIVVESESGSEVILVPNDFTMMSGNRYDNISVYGRPVVLGRTNKQVLPFYGRHFSFFYSTRKFLNS